MMQHIRSMITALLPPILKMLYRKIVPVRPMFRGVFASPAAIVDENPWVSRVRLAEVDAAIVEAKANAATRPLGTDFLIPTFLINACIQGPCRVLDFGGGAGIAYFQCRSFLHRPDRVDWTVVDSPELAAIGRRHAGPEHRLRFLETLPAEAFDLVYVNTVFQYIPGYREVLSALMGTRPTWLVLTRLVAGDNPVFFTEQCNIPGGTTSCMFLNRSEVVSFCANLGYKPIHQSLAPEDVWDANRYRDVPASQQLRYTVNIVFRADGVAV